MPYKDPEHAKIARKRWYKRNRKAVLAKVAKWGREHPDAARNMRLAHPERYKFAAGKSEAKRRKLPWLLTFEQYVNITTRRDCHYCHNPLPRAGYGLDRLDSQLGYEYANVVPCCASCNWRKGGLEVAGFKFPRTVELLLEVLRAE